MTDEQIVLARRAVACKGWRWMPGMAGTDALGVPFRCALTHRSGGVMVVAGMAVMVAHPDALARMYPDLTDPATLGCLLALVREAWGDPAICVVLDTSDGYWHVGRWESEGIALRGRWGTTEAHALVLSLEAAPCPTT